MNFKELAIKYDTPLYVYDFNHFTEQFNKLKKAFKARKSIIAMQLRLIQI
jgi:diaminopimelate decarboxylase